MHTTRLKQGTTQSALPTHLTCAHGTLPKTIYSRLRGLAPVSQILTGTVLACCFRRHVPVLITARYTFHEFVFIWYRKYHYAVCFITWAANSVLKFIKSSRETGGLIVFGPSLPLFCQHFSTFRENPWSIFLQTTHGWPMGVGKLFWPISVTLGQGS